MGHGTDISYLLVTPYTIVKSRTGGVISRLLSRVDLELIGAQIFAPGSELTVRYAKSIAEQNDPIDPKRSVLLSRYVLQNFSPSDGRRHRVLMLLFRGEDPYRKLSDVVGALYSEDRSIESVQGETIRDTYSDLVMSKTEPGKVEYMEPAVLSPRRKEYAIRNLRIFSDFIRNEPNIVENVVHPNPDRIERTLVIIKPDNWRFPSSKPGTIIDMFSRTGLRVIGCKIFQMSVAEAVEFYEPVRGTLIERLSPYAGEMAKNLLEKHFEMKIGRHVLASLTESFGKAYAEDQFTRIVEFMTGRRSDRCPKKEVTDAGKVKCMVLVYEGEDAVRKIREVLGPTDPTKAPGGTVRREFGSDIMVNTAHASDSVENAVREMKIVKIQQNDLCQLIDSYLLTEDA